MARWLSSEDVLERLAWSFATRGVPPFIRSDNGSEFPAEALRAWLGKVGVKTLSIEPGSPWNNGDVESFNGKFRDPLLDREIFYTLLEAKILIERWREHYNRVRPHRSLDYRPPAPEGIAFEALATGCSFSFGKSVLPFIGQVEAVEDGSDSLAIGALDGHCRPGAFPCKVALHLCRAGRPSRHDDGRGLPGRVRMW